MSADDPELQDLLVSELERHASALAQGKVDREALQRILHSVKGTSGIAGETELSEAFARLEKRIEEPGVQDRALQWLRDGLARMRQGLPAHQDPWPAPPAELGAVELPSHLAARYASEMRERVARLDEVLTSTSEPDALLEQALRHLHAMKGAAGAVRDELMAWFCHGLETRVREAMRAPAPAHDMLEDLAHWRSVLVELIDDPRHAIASLRAEAGEETSLPSGGPTNAAPAPEGEAWLHVQASAIDSALERLRRVSHLGREVEGHSESARTTARNVRAIRKSLLEARRLIGPPRPWGAPAAALLRIETAVQTLAATAADMERFASTARHQARAVQSTAAASHTDLGTLRRATMEVVFETVHAAISATAERAGRHVRIEQRGAATAIDRRLAEALVDPVLQVARNAVAHGIEDPTLRAALGKPPWGHVLLSAEARGAHLIVTVRDDGAGVDIVTLRRRLISSGRISKESARDADDEALLHLLFMPGLTTRQQADLLAGRGMGLDLALRAVRRLGGTIRIRNRTGQGLACIIDVPLVERGLARVVWVRSLGNRFALPARHVLQVRGTSAPGPHPPALATCIDADLHGEESGFIVDVGRSLEAGDFASVSVGAIDGIEEASVRPVPPLVATAGPYVGVILAADGTPSLLLDVLLVADRTRGTRRGGSSTMPPPIHPQ